MKEKVLKRICEKRISKIFTFILAVAMLVNTINVPMQAHAEELTINNITWGTGDNDTVLSWDPVEGATSYQVEMSRTGYTYTTSLDCKSIISETRTYIPTVRAYKDDGALIAEAQGPEKYFEIPQLATPSNIKVENGVISWDVVPNTAEYVVSIYVYNERTGLPGACAGYKYTQANKIRLSSITTDLSEGTTYIVGVEAYNRTGGYARSEEGFGSTFLFQGYSMATITNISWGTGENDRVLSWDPVVDAVKYMIFINGMGTTTDHTSYNCKSLIRSEGNFIPTISAYDENNELIAETTGPKKYFTMPKLATPGNIKIENNMITWDAVSDAQEYIARLYRYDEETDTDISVTYRYASVNRIAVNEFLDITEGETYCVTVSALERSGDFAQSEPGKSEYFVYAITFAVNTSVVGNGGTISGSATVKNHENYIVTLKPQKGYVIDYLKVNGTDVTSEIVNNKYTITDITADKKVEAGFSTCRHNWDAGVVTAEATCKTAGEMLYTCSICEGTKTETVPKLTTHTWDDGEVYEEPTCGEAGVFRYTCKVCEITRDEILSATNNHSYGEYVVTIEPTCGNTGIRTRTCTVCKHTDEETVPATGKHHFSSVTHTCTVCGAEDPSYVPLPTIATQPANVTVKDGATAKFTVVANDAETYQWQVSTDAGKTWNNSTASNAKTASLSFTAKTSYSGRKYRCVVKNKAGSVTSKVVTLTVNAAVSKPVITTQPVAVNAAAGETVKFSIVATGATTYQWQYSGNGGSTWSNCSGTGYNTASLSFSMAAKYNGRQYRCVVTNASGSVNSTAVALTLKVAASKPVITTQPVAVNAAAGETVKFSIVATGATAYQWQYSSNGGSTWSNCSGTGYNTASLSFSMAAKYNGRQYRCVVTNASGSVNSTAVALTLKVAASKPVITAQPVAVNAAAGETVKFSIAATGVTSYQWQFSADNGSTWSNCSGTGYNTANLSFSMAAKYAGRLYRCVVKNAQGSVNSNAVALTLKTAAKPVITTQPVAVNAAAGETVRFSIAATGATAYQWQFSGDNGSTWSNCAGTGYNTANLSFTMAAKYNGRLYRCVVKNAQGSTNSTTAALTLK